jgi:2,3,4,5-tetrahydropyridine-2,6-dicarboxylate N-succinyltransferase
MSDQHLSPLSAADPRAMLGDVRLGDLAALIDHAWETRSSAHQSTEVHEAVEIAISALDQGILRVAERQGVGQWVVNQWVKKAVLLAFSLNDVKVMNVGGVSYYDKIDSKLSTFDEATVRHSGIRIVPPATIRRGAYIARNVVVMPSFVNIGSYVDESAMVDSCVSVGSCAQIGKRVHLSMGVQIGGVLEPIQASPTIIEDDCFIGVNSSVVEGVVVEEGSVISMGVHIGRSTKIYDRETGQVHNGRVPSRSVVVAGTLPSADGSYAVACALIVKKVDAQTRSRTSINELLRS